MSNYDIFAYYYDSLTLNVDYAGRADYISEILARKGHDSGITLDLACGTGSLTVELKKRGFDIYGIDSSVSMLSIAKDKSPDTLFLCQKMQNLDLYGTVDTVVCALDSINHLSSKEQIQQAFNKVSFFMNPEGLFIFDFNTVYKHENVLKDNVFIYDTENVYCVWQNRLKKKSARVDISLDFFGKEGKKYVRSSEHFSEITFPVEEVLEMLRLAGFKETEVYDDMSFESPKPDSQRVVFVAKK